MKRNVLRDLMGMFWVMYPQVQGIDFRRDVPKLDVPVYFLAGEAELAARQDLALERLKLLDSPSKRSSRSRMQAIRWRTSSSRRSSGSWWRPCYQKPIPAFIDGSAGSG